MKIIGDKYSSSFEEVVESYKDYLTVKSPSHHNAFCNREKNDKESTIVEATSFMLFRNTFEFDVTIGEDIAQGGVDFICKNAGTEFVAEVTHINRDSISRYSGLEEDNLKFRSYSLITELLRTKATNKASQVANYPMSRVLVIGSSHRDAGLLFGKSGAEALLTSDTAITAPINSTIDQVQEETDLANSVFFRLGKNGIEPCRQSFSAIILSTIYSDRLSLIGILHPQPRVSFNISILPEIPFCRVSNWPCIDKKIEKEWIKWSYKPREESFTPVKFKGSDLTQMD